MLQVAKACLRIYFWMQWQLVKSSPQKVKTAGKWVYSDYQVGFPLSLTRMDGWMDGWESLSYSLQVESRCGGRICKTKAAEAFVPVCRNGL